MTATAWSLLAAVSAGITAAAALRLLLRPAPPLARLVRPYLAWGRSRLSLPPDPGPRLAGRTAPRDLLVRLAAVVDGVGDEALTLRLAQAGVLQDVNPGDRAVRYRMRRLLGAVAAGLLGGLLAVARGTDPAGALMLIALGVGGAVAYGRGKLDRLIEQRRVRIRIELYTVEQLLAVRLRVGASVASAVRQLVSRSRGEVAGELGEALRLHAGGMSLGQALRRVAQTTPEPHAMRCYRTLASGHERGADVAASILALSEDVRDDRREALRRAATRGRALMLVPIVGILAPVLLLFVGAPLPWMVLRGLG